ncbi:hypothetical protein P3342_006498 [Pyrenophora teres f. teres]|nr:hypothetical protein P3342_006498 [Pyrenophora teres f. teres]
MAMLSQIILRPPHLPADIESLDELGRARIQEEYRHRHVHFFYLRFTRKFNTRHWSALEDKVDILRRRVFDYASEPWEGLNTPLQYDFVQVAQVWNEITSLNHDTAASTCPVSFTEEEAKQIDALDDLHRDADNDMERINWLLGIASDGWTPHERFESARSKAVEFREQGLASVDDDQWLREISERHWPFDDYDENE